MVTIFGHLYTDMLKKVAGDLKFIFFFRAIQRITLSESSQLSELLEDIQNIVCSRPAVGHNNPTPSPDPSIHLPITPSPEKTDFYGPLGKTVSEDTKMYFSTPEKADEPGKTGAFSGPDFVTPTKVLDVSDYSTEVEL